MVDRFIIAHRQLYKTALGELKRGYKQSCWMWFIFPQIAGLGFSETAKYYEIQSRLELLQYASNKELNKHTLELYRTLESLPETNPNVIFGTIDARKLQSHLTLFATVPKYKKQCYNLIDKYFNGTWDFDTIKLYTDWDKEK